MKIPTTAALLTRGLLLVLGVPAAFAAEPARLLVDARQGAPDLAQSFGYFPPVQFTEVAGHAIFLVDSFDLSGAYRAVPGPQVELWASDGTPAGTRQLAAFCQDGVESCHLPPRLLGQAGGVAFLEIPEPGFDAFHRELWRTDGTPEGTFRLPSELCPGDPSAGATEVVAGGSLYYAGFDSRGCEPWVSDGTAAGTVEAADLQSGEETDSFPQSFAALGERVYFTAGFGGDLWSTDGTPGGTVRVHRFPSLQLLTTVGRRLFFMVLEYPRIALWTSDGTADGTRRVRSFPFTTCRDCDVVTSFLQPDGDGVLFLAGDGRHGPQLWRSDGTSEGTRLLAALPADAAFGLNGGDPATALVDLGSALVFPVDRNGLAQLWASRPPAARAARLTGCPEGCPTVISQPRRVPGTARAVFGGRGPRGNEELWASDGTAAGTRPVRQVCSGPCSSSLQGFVALGGLVYFSAVDASGPSLWRTDGTPEGTVEIGRASLPLAAGGIALGDRVLLGATAGARTSELWTTDGTAATTGRLKTFSRLPAPSSNPSFAPLGGQVVFTAQAGADSALWASGGTSTRRLIGLPDACADACDSLSPPVAAGGLAFTISGLATEQGILDARLLRTDGTRAGTLGIHDFGPDSFVLMPFAFGGRLVFFRCGTAVAVPQTNLSNCELWASDGTAAGTAPFASLPPLEFFLNSSLPPVVVGDHFDFFVSTGPATLYSSDGTAAGTRPLASFDASGNFPLEVAEAGGSVYVSVDGGLERLDAAAPGGVGFSFGQNVSGLQEMNGRLLFFGASTEDTPRTGLWSSDGTEAGTGLLAPVLAQTLDLNLGLYGSPRWTRLGPRRLFRGWDVDHGFELWATDGTPAGTLLVSDLAPGKASSFPDFLTPVGDEVWFAANDAVHGDELWATDGTAAGTRLVADLAPGQASSSPLGLTLAGKNLFFSADLVLTGREPWVLPLQ
jgi:ELWxxDGT repeat protein